MFPIQSSLGFVPPPTPKLWPCSPYSRGSRWGVVIGQCPWILPSLTCPKGLLSSLLREGLTIAACSDQSWVELAPSHWGRWMLLLFSKKQTKVTVYILARFSSRSEAECWVWLGKLHFSWVKSHVLAVHTDASRERGSREAWSWGFP